MAVLGCSVTTTGFSAVQGTTVPAGIVYLTITSNDGEPLSHTEFFVGGDGANVSEGITDVIFSSNPDGTVKVAVHHGEIIADESKSFHVDIDRQEISVPPPPPPPPPVLVQGCTNPLADNYDPNAEEDDGSCIISDPDPDPEQEPLVYGCMNPNAINYNPAANVPGPCYYADPPPPDPEDEVYMPCTGGSCIYEPLGRELELPFRLYQYPPAQSWFAWTPDYGDISVPDFWDYDWQVIDDLHPGFEGVVGQGVEDPVYSVNSEMQVGYWVTIVSCLNLDTNEPYDFDGQLEGHLPRSYYAIYDNWEDIVQGPMTNKHTHPITLSGEPLNLKFVLGICFKYYDSQGNIATYNCTQDYFWSYAGDSSGSENTRTRGEVENEDVNYVEYTPKFYNYTIGGKTESGDQARKDGGISYDPYYEEDDFYYTVDGGNPSNFPTVFHAGGGVNNSFLANDTNDYEPGDFHESLSDSGINQESQTTKNFGDNFSDDWVMLMVNNQVPDIYPTTEEWFEADGSEKVIKIASFKYWAKEGKYFTSDSITLQSSLNSYGDNMVGVFSDLAFGSEEVGNEMLYATIENEQYQDGLLVAYEVCINYVPAKRINWGGPIPSLQTQTRYNVFSEYDYGPGIVVKPSLNSIETFPPRFRSANMPDNIKTPVEDRTAPSQFHSLSLIGDKDAEFLVYIKDEWGKYYNTNSFTSEEDADGSGDNIPEEWVNEPPTKPVKLRGLVNNFSWRFQNIDGNDEPQRSAEIWFEPAGDTEFDESIPTRENTKTVGSIFTSNKASVSVDDTGMSNFTQKTFVEKTSDTSRNTVKLRVGVNGVNSGTSLDFQSGIETTTDKRYANIKYANFDELSFLETTGNFITVEETLASTGETIEYDAQNLPDYLDIDLSFSIKVDTTARTCDIYGDFRFSNNRENKLETVLDNGGKNVSVSINLFNILNSA
jgi:hypothetical protein